MSRQKFLNNNMRKSSKLIVNSIIIAFCLFLLTFAGIILIGFIMVSTTEIHGTLINPPKSAADFNLQSENGTVTLSNFNNKLLILYFGYTFCPDHCPLTLSKLKNGISKLNPDEASNVQVVMVSVDPERDGIKKISYYIHSFSPDFIGLTGTPAEIKDAAKKYGIYYQKVKGNYAGGYLIDHTTSILVLDKQGRLCLIWPSNVEPDAIAGDLRLIISRQKF